MDLAASDFSSWLIILQTFETFSHLASDQNVSHSKGTKRKSIFYLADVMEAEFNGPKDENQVKKCHSQCLKDYFVKRVLSLKTLALMFIYSC